VTLTLTGERVCRVEIHRPIALGVGLGSGLVFSRISAPYLQNCRSPLLGVIMALTLYHNDMSVCAQKVRLCLAEKQLAYEDRHLNLRAGDQKRPEYLALNPNGYVPTLVHDDFVLGESMVICEYIDDAFTARPLKPADPKERARMRGFTKFIDAAIFPATATVSMSIAFHHQYTPEMYDTMEKGSTRLARQLPPAPERHRESSVSRRHPAARQDDRRYGTGARRPPRSVAVGRYLYAC
jgi:glutathione S-transferase